MDTEYRCTFRIERKKNEYPPDTDFAAEAQLLRGTLFEWAGELFGPQGKNPEGEWIHFTPLRWFPDDGSGAQPDLAGDEVYVQATQVVAELTLQRTISEG